MIGPERLQRHKRGRQLYGRCGIELFIGGLGRDRGAIKCFSQHALISRNRR